MNLYSISPTNKKYELPDDRKTNEEIAIIKTTCRKERNYGKEIVVIQGLGFVGAIMAAVVADCKIKNENPYFVIGVDLPTKQSFWKIPIMNSGKSPFIVEDPEVDKIFKRTVIEKTNLRATWIKEVYAEADIIVVDINLDVIKLEIGNSIKFEVKFDAFKEAMRDIGNLVNPKSLILIETTVPPGTIEKIIIPIIEDCFKKRNIDPKIYPPLIAHCYERVMPGKNYVNSIKKIWRTFSSNNTNALNKAKRFLNNIIDTKNYPLSELRSTNASELGKILENSYRAMNIAFIYEWTLFAEDLGINLFKVVDSIRVRKGTHDNLMYPGFGVGGYCLPKDPLLAEWASKNLFNRVESLNLSIKAVNINDLMPYHTFDLLKKGMDDNLKNSKVTILGASYRKDVDDTRNSPTILLYDAILEAGGIPIVHDPYAIKIEGRNNIKIYKNIDSVLEGTSAVVFVVNHKQYEKLPLENLISRICSGACIIDAFNVLSDNKLKFLKQQNYVVLGVGKGHIKYL